MKKAQKNLPAWVFGAVFLLFGSLHQSIHAQSSPSTTYQYEVVDKDTVYFQVEVMPTFPGGQNSLLRYLASNIFYPPEARFWGADGKVSVRFMVDHKGKVKQVGIKKSVVEEKPGVELTDEEKKEIEIYRLLDKEAIRVVKKMPAWNPGIINGKPVNTWHALPITFRLEEKMMNNK